MRRRLVLILLPLALLPAGAAASVEKAPADGTLSLKDGRGKITLVVRGSIIGRFARGQATIEDLDLTDANRPIVKGADRVLRRNSSAPTYIGKNGVRLRLLDGRYRLKMNASGVHLSVVGRGRVTLDGAGSLGQGIFYDGFYSLNGSEYVSLPDELESLSLTPTPPPPPGS